LNKHVKRNELKRCWHTCEVVVTLMLKMLLNGSHTTLARNMMHHSHLLVMHLVYHWLSRWMMQVQRQCGHKQTLMLRSRELSNGICITTMEKEYLYRKKTVRMANTSITKMLTCLRSQKNATIGAETLL